MAERIWKTVKRSLTFLSLVLNVILLGAIFFVTRKPAEKFTRAAANEGSNSGVTQIVETISQINIVLPTVTAPFDWSMMESEDFLVYAENLRGIGCPEETVRDILTAEINDLFVHRRQDLFRPLQAQFWDLMAQGSENFLIPAETEEKVDALNEEKEELLEKVLGSALQEEKYPVRSEYESVMKGSLSPEQEQQFRNVSEKFDKDLEKIKSSELSEAEKQKQEVLWNERLAAEQAGVLSPEEMEEYKLRTSSFAQQRANLRGFNATEQEFREMARLSLNEKPVPRDDESQQDKAKIAALHAEKEKIDQQMKALLEESRFKEYERAKDSNFRNLNFLGDRYNLSPQTIVEVYELTRSIHQQVQDFKKSNVDSEERDAALETIRQQTDRTMIEKLGARAAETYRRNFNNWDEIPDP